MPKPAACDSTAALLDRLPPRGSVAAAIAAAPWTAAAHVRATQAPAAGGEARVIRLCAELETIEGRIEALHLEYRALQDESRLDEALAPLNRTLRAKLDRLCATSASSPASILARLRLLATVAPEWADARDAGNCIPSSILAAVLRDVAGSAA